MTSQGMGLVLRGQKRDDQPNERTTAPGRLSVHEREDHDVIRRVARQSGVGRVTPRLGEAHGDLRGHQGRVDKRPGGRAQRVAKGSARPSSGQRKVSSAQFEE